MDKQQIAYRLKEYMKSNDMSKAQIGRFIGRDSRSVGRYLDGQMSDDIAVKLIELIKTGGAPMQEYTKKKKKGSKTAIGIRPEARAFVDTYKKLNAHKNTIPVEIETHGFEEAAEKIELMADAIDSLPATVNIKAKDCEVNIHTTNIIEPKETFKTYAPGGVIKPKPDYEPEAEMIDRLISKLPPSDREKELTMLARIKDICKHRDKCEGCWYDDSGQGDCVLSGGIPENWLI